MTTHTIPLGSGRPKICVPLVSASLAALEIECESLAAVPFDLLEWRIDYLLADESFSYETDLPKAYDIIRKHYKDAVILTTLRTKSQGGSYELSDETYGKILHFLLKNHLADLLDIEEGHELALTDLISTAREKEIPVLMSYHKFSGPLSFEELTSIYRHMKSEGADILKIAVMPKVPKDTATLLLAAATLREEFPDTPVIAIGMGALGQLTRIAGNDLGGPLTFAAGQKASAPGQLSAKDAKGVLELLYGKAEEGE